VDGVTPNADAKYTRGRLNAGAVAENILATFDTKRCQLSSVASLSLNAARRAGLSATADPCHK